MGFLQFSLAWILGDAGLLLAFVFEAPSWVLALTLGLLHLLAWTSFLRFSFLRLRRRGDAFKENSESIYGQALQAWMKGADEDVVPLLRGLLRKDPWCFPALVLWAKVLHAAGKKRKALRMARVAASLATDPNEVAFIEDEVLWAVPKKQVPNPPQPKPKPKDQSQSGPGESPRTSRKLRAKGA